MRGMALLELRGRLDAAAAAHIDVHQDQVDAHWSACSSASAAPPASATLRNAASLRGARAGRRGPGDGRRPAEF
jgi:hypothetical protein